MITLRRLDLVRQESPATAEELASLQTQLNALPALQIEAHVTTTMPAVAMTLLGPQPSGYVEIVVRGQHYVLPFFVKD